MPNKYLLRIFGATLIIGMIYLICGFANGFSAGIYILDGGTGNGSAWNNALDQVPAMTGITRGDTLYIGDGSYTAVTWSKAVSGTTKIFVIKATASEHGLGTGWDAAYGDGVATFSGASPTWLISTDYWVFDGMTGSGKTGHGFKLTTTTLAATSYLIQIAGGVDYITLSHIEGEQAGMETLVKRYGLYANGVTSPISNIRMSYCYIHHVSIVHVLLRTTSNSCFENSYFEYRNISPGGSHGESFSIGTCVAANDTIRFNVFKDILGTAYLAWLDSDQSGFEIYGNVFYTTDSATYLASNGVIANDSGSNNSDMHVYNNTFYNIQGTSSTAVDVVDWSGGTGTGNITKNNLVYGGRTANLVGTQTADYNASDVPGTGMTGGNNVTITTNPFINSAGYDFTLNAHGNADSVYNKGVTLGSPYNADIVGLARPQNTGYDIGAYELYQAPESPDPPTAPATQIIRPTWATLTWTPADSTVIEINGVASDTLAVTDSSCIIITTPHTRYTVVFKTLTDGVVYGGSSVSFTTPGKTVGRGTRKRIQ